MAKPESSSRAQEIMGNAVNGAARRQRQVQRVSNALADLMQEIYGGSFSVSINDRTQFVMIAQDQLESTGGVNV
jgi:hypothetical protein